MFYGLGSVNHAPIFSNSLFKEKVQKRAIFKTETWTYSKAVTPLRFSRYIVETNALRPLHPNRKWNSCWTCNGEEKISESKLALICIFKLRPSFELIIDSHGKDAYKLDEANGYQMNTKEDKVMDMISFLKKFRATAKVGMVCLSWAHDVLYHDSIW